METLRRDSPLFALALRISCRYGSREPIGNIANPEDTVKHFTMLFLTLFFAPLAEARESHEYDLMTWETVATLSVQNNRQHEIDARGFSGQFVRLTASSDCGSLGVGISAEARPFTPRMVYDRNASVWTPATQRMHWYIAQERDVDFQQIWIGPGRIDSRSCDVTVEVAKGDSLDPVDPTTPTVFAEGAASSRISEQVVMELAWNRTVARAQALCRTLDVARVPGRNSCTAYARGSHWSAQCNAWFYCLPGL